MYTRKNLRTALHVIRFFYWLKQLLKSLPVYLLVARELFVLHYGEHASAESYDVFRKIQKQRTV